MSSGECVAENVIARKQQMAVLVPGYNEESAVAKVVADFSSALPTAAVYVCDNNSTDKTAEVVRAAGAVVRRETYQGKGHVVRRMFNDVEAERPLSLFGAFGIALAIVAIGFAIPIFHRLRAGSSGAALANRGALDRSDAACVPLDRGRPHPRYRDARPPLAQASGLARLAGAR